MERLALIDVIRNGNKLIADEGGNPADVSYIVVIITYFNNLISENKYGPELELERINYTDYRVKRKDVVVFDFSCPESKYLPDTDIVNVLYDIMDNYDLKAKLQLAIK